MACGGPYTCKFPRAQTAATGDLWICPDCASEYRLSRRKPERWWRNWSAPHGYWRLTLVSRLGWSRATRTTDVRNEEP